jgi:hypothetical protein
MHTVNYNLSWSGIDVISNILFVLESVCVQSVREQAMNIAKVLTAARAVAGRVVFVTTTPFYQYHDYSYPCVLQLNAVALQVVNHLNQAAATTSSTTSSDRVATTIKVADLFGAVEGFCGKNYTTCPIQLNNNLHFSTAWSPPSVTIATSHHTLFFVSVFLASHRSGGFRSPLPVHDKQDN